MLPDPTQPAEQQSVDEKDRDRAIRALRTPRGREKRIMIEPLAEAIFSKCALMARKKR